MLRRVALVRIEVSEKCIASNIRMTRFGDPETTLVFSSNRNFEYFFAAFRLLVTINVVPSSPNLVTLMLEAIHFSESYVPIKQAVRFKKTAFFYKIFI
jgi:hypothetical protein